VGEARIGSALPREADNADVRVDPLDVLVVVHPTNVITRKRHLCELKEEEEHVRGRAGGRAAAVAAHHSVTIFLFDAMKPRCSDIISSPFLSTSVARTSPTELFVIETYSRTVRTSSSSCVGARQHARGGQCDRRPKSVLTS
jgi:hypothetical protein